MEVRLSICEILVHRNIYFFSFDLLGFSSATDVYLSSYSKLLLASKGQVLSLLAEEREALQIQLSQEKDDPQACFIQSALLMLQVRHAFTRTQLVLERRFKSNC